MTNGEIMQMSADNKLNDVDRLLQAMSAEIDAIIFYVSLARQAKNPKVRKLLLDVAREEKVHLAEFATAILQLDKEQRQAAKEGVREAKQLMKTALLNLLTT